jgi:GNAT superfamily N-acetyltransferase
VPKPPPIAFDLPLRDGTVVRIRPILPSDGPRLREGFDRLSVESRYRRFMTAIDELSDQQVRYLTEIDYENHMAWVAVDPSSPDAPGLGVSRYVRSPDDPTVAEAAVTVIDAWQGRGLGSLLLAVLGLHAVRNGITTFRAYVLEENAPMIGILHELGATTSHEGGFLRVDVPLPKDPADLPDTAVGAVFRAVAQHLLPPFDDTFPDSGKD